MFEKDAHGIRLPRRKKAAGPTLVHGGFEP
jgi:hypothetical protein